VETTNTYIAPAFGQAVLSNCEREQIHLPGSIQPHGALLVFDGLAVVQASSNAAGFLGISGNVVGKSAEAVAAELPERIAALAADRAHELPINFPCTLRESGGRMDCLLHRNDDGFAIAEFLRPQQFDRVWDRTRESVRTIVDSNSLDELCDRAADTFFTLTGYNRVMVYQFDAEGHGRIRSEKFEGDLEPYVGLRYPASDIPQIARKLYLRNRVRMLVSVDYSPVPIEPRLNPATREDLDMSMSFLRSISPIHIQYLKNMGVAATLVISLVVGGKLWGLIACHHQTAREIPTGQIAACELLAEAVATRIAAFEGNAQAQVVWTVRRFESQLVEGISRLGNWREALFHDPEYLLRSVDAHGAAVFVDGQVQTTGVVPGTNNLLRIRDWLLSENDKGDAVIATASLGEEEAQFRGFADVASGILAVRISASPAEYLVWFRPEQIRTDTWGGDPQKAIEYGDDPEELSPRRSFAKWHEEVKGKSEPWSPVAINVARRIGESIADIAVHYRSVRALIVKDQLGSVFHQVSSSNIPAIIADVGRKILLANEAFHSLLPPGQPHLDRLEELSALFRDAPAFRQKLADLCDRQLPWRGEVELGGGESGPHPLMLRGDPVFISERRLIGFVLMFTSLKELRNAESARKEFHRRIDRQQNVLRKGGPAIDFNRRRLEDAIIGNARMSALDLADGEDIDRIPEMLDSVRGSVGRSLELLQYIRAWELDSGSDEST